MSQVRVEIDRGDYGDWRLRLYDGDVLIKQVYRGTRWESDFTARRMIRRFLNGQIRKPDVKPERWTVDA